MRQTYKYHPQPSSRAKIKEALNRVDVRDKVILDCFCGTGTILLEGLLHGAKGVIGCDIEDYNQYLRKGLRKYYDSRPIFGPQKIKILWGFDAIKAVSELDYDILIFDPPNPKMIVGGALPSVIRDTGLSGNELRKFWKARFNEENLIGKRVQTIEAVREIINIALRKDKGILVNLFTSRGFDYYQEYTELDPSKIYDTWYALNLSLFM